MAGDIAIRLADLRHHLGVRQPAFAKLFGRGRKQVSAWENQRQAPPPAVLEWAAEQNGWPLEMFAEGGPMPSAVLHRPLTPRTHDVTGIDSARTSDSATASYANGHSAAPTDAEVRTLVSQRLAEWRRSGVAPPDWEVMTWLDLAMRARRSGPSE